MIAIIMILEITMIIMIIKILLAVIMILIVVTILIIIMMYAKKVVSMFSDYSDNVNTYDGDYYNENPNSNNSTIKEKLRGEIKTQLFLNKYFSLLYG